MTLFESLVAIVILGLAAVGFLGAFQATSRSTRQAGEWVVAVGHAEAAMEETKLGISTGNALGDSLPGGFTRTVAVQPWPELAGMERVTVTVTMPGGGAFSLERLVRPE
jgi:type II secretory pathway pseudopilin PulG